MAMRVKKNIIADMLKGFDMTLADEVVAFCKKNNSDPYVEFIDLARLPAMAYSEWTKPAAQTYLARRMAPSPRSAWSTKAENALAFETASVNALEEHFVHTEENGETLYRIVDYKHRVIEMCADMNQEFMVAQIMKKTLRAAGVGTRSLICKQILDAYKCVADHVAKPVLLGQLGEANWALARMTVAPDASVPWPKMRLFTERLNDPEAFGAFVYGVASGRNKGRQILYICSPEGTQGKSSFMTAMERLIAGKHAEAVCTSFNSRKMENDHASYQFKGKKFVTVGDNKNPNIIMTQTMKELSGEDRSVLNGKYRPITSEFLECRVVILSNYEPNISSESHNTSRTLYLRLAPYSGPVIPNLAAGYDAEFPGFLAWAKQCYAARCADDYEILTNDAVNQVVQLRITEFEDMWRLPFEKYFVKDLSGKAKLTATEFNRVVFEDLKWDVNKASNFKQWIERSIFGGAECKVPDARGGGWHYCDIRIKRGRDADTEHETLLTEVVG